MSDQKNLEQRLREAPFRSDADVDHAVLSDLLTHWNRTTGRRGGRPGLRRHIMTSTTGKLAAAGIVLTLVVTGLVHWGDHSAGVALGDVLESMQHVPWIHVTATVEAPGNSGVMQQWDNYDHSITIMKDADGVITYRDYQAQTMYVYQPKTNTVTISRTTDRFNLPSPAASVEALIAEQEAEGAKVHYENTVHEGIAVRKILVENEQQDVTLFCDRSSGLPLTMETVAVLPGMSTPATASAVFDYPTEGPGDIFALGVPADAEIVDNRPTGDAADLIEQVQSHFDAGFADHLAVMLESHVEANGVLEPGNIVVMWQQLPRKRMSHYRAFHYTGSKSDWPTLYPLVKDRWPDLTIADVLTLVSDDVAETQWIFDGTTSTNRSNFSNRPQTQTIETDMFDHGTLDSLAGLSWPNPSSLQMAGADTQKRLEALPPDAEHLGLAGFQITTTPTDPEGRLPGTTTKAQVVSYWFDPAKDYLLIERASRIERNEGVSEYLQITMETAQMPDGRWYPTLIESSSSYPHPDGHIVHSATRKQIMVDASPVFDESTFDGAALLGSADATH